MRSSNSIHRFVWHIDRISRFRGRYHHTTQLSLLRLNPQLLRDVGGDRLHKHIQRTICHPCSIGRVLPTVNQIAVFNEPFSPRRINRVLRRLLRLPPVQRFVNRRPERLYLRIALALSPRLLHNQHISSHLITASPRAFFVGFPYLQSRQRTTFT